ncbi:MAG: M20/M25/M40 family metallo-hydrolase [Anaerolineae bacterium]
MKTLVAVLAVVQVGILIYLGTLLWPTEPGEMAQGTPTIAQFELPSAPTVVPGTTPDEPPEDDARLVVGPLPAATNITAVARGFDEEEALTVLSHLASQSLGGRQPGTSGGWEAGDYVATQFAAVGLEPAGVDQTYFQTFTLPYGEITTMPELTIIPPAGDVLTRSYDYRIDYRALTGGYLGTGSGEGPVVWLNDCLHDAYAGQDLVGDIVLCRYTGNEEVYRQAIEHQVGGLLLLDRERDGEPFRRGGYRETTWVPETIPAYLVSEAVGRDLLAGTEYTLDDLSLRFSATPLSTTVRMGLTVEEEAGVPARNVLGLLPGADPERANEVVVVGAHYDHLGREPDDAVMAGANDNASGVAAVVEIARLWHTAGYQPARSVLFAAWDGEEQGLLGSQYYVEHPSLSLTQTVGMINLDMVGAGETLRVDGAGDLAAQVQSAAQVYAITTTHTFVGRSDHVPFDAAGIPAVTLIYWPDPNYHTPDDQIAAISPDKLRAAGILAAHSVASLADSHVELERAVERLRAAIATGDRQAFLESLDPTDPDLRAAQAAWFDSLWIRGLSEITIEPSRMRVGDGAAEATLTLAYHWADSGRREPSVSYDARFVDQSGTWRFSGYDLDTLAGEALSVARFSDVPVGGAELLTTTQRAYLNLAADLGVEPVTDTHVIFYPNAATMRAIARPGASRDTRWLVPSAGRAEIAWGQPITPALANLTLNQIGLPPTEGLWLREGLARHYDENPSPDALPILASTETVTPLLDLPHPMEISAEQAAAVRAMAWSATEYLLNQYGIAGLRDLCAAWGDTGDPDTAFQQALGLSPARFEAAWRADYLEPLRATADAIQGTLNARTAAVLAGDEAAFMDTVTSRDPVLRTEERNWFADLANHLVVEYDAQGEIASWSPAADAAVVTLNVTAVLSDGRRSDVTHRARFVRQQDQWRYAGVDWNELSSEHFLVKHQSLDAAQAQRTLDLLEAAYAQVTGDLDLEPNLLQEVKVYDEQDLFRTSIFLSLPEWASGWTEPGEAIKFWLRETDDHFIQRVVAHELTHQVLFAAGLEVDWLHEGVANFEAGRVIPLGTHWMAGRYGPDVQEAVSRHETFPITEFPTWDEVANDRVTLFYAQSWSLISYVAERYGIGGLRRLIDQALVTDDMATMLRMALGEDPGRLEEAWQTYARTAGAPEDLVAAAQRFDPQRALEDVALLASPAYDGRATGTPGADRAARTIAEWFTELGLQPLGDPVTATAESPLTFQQTFPISYSAAISTPELTLLDEDGTLHHAFTYREDFVESSVTSATVEGELVWLRPRSLEGLHFGGAVVIEQHVGDPLARAAELQAHGAGGLIIVTDQDSDDLQTTHVRPTAPLTASIPVFEITGAAFDTLLEQLDLELGALTSSPPALPLQVQVRQVVDRSPITTTQTSNVLGLLPGRDPDLADQVLVIGAHYDHIGRAPDGRLFPGANRNASGVAAMVEMVRAWQAEGIRPARSVLFAAWGAEELDSAGVAYYMDHPALPLTRTVGVIALDSIAGGRGYRLLFHGSREEDLALVQRVETAAATLDRRAWRRGSVGQGWHDAFHAADIPTVKLIWDEAEEDFYLPTDTADNIDPERLATSGEILTLSAAWLAGQ